jgi:hypothetical protein
MKEFITLFKKSTNAGRVMTERKYLGVPVAGFYRGVYILLDVTDTEVEIVLVWTPKLKRGDGKARRALTFLSSVSAACRIPLCVIPHTYDNDGMPLDALARWFFRQGVRVIGGVPRYLKEAA